jgi:hypothetical protein
MIILPNQKAVFIHVPKTGGDSISRFLINNVPGAHHSSGGKHWASWMHENNGYPRWFKFGFVREPVSWYRSFYSFIQNNYIVPYGAYPVFEPGMYHPMRRWEKYDFSTFDKMVQSVLADDPSYYTRLIDWMLGPRHSRMVNFIGKQEMLKDDLAIVLDQLGLKKAADKCGSMPRINFSSSSKIIPANRTILQIWDHENAVYERFNYVKK